MHQKKKHKKQIANKAIYKHIINKFKIMKKIRTRTVDKKHPPLQIPTLVVISKANVVGFLTWVSLLVPSSQSTEGLTSPREGEGRVASAGFFSFKPR